MLASEPLLEAVREPKRDASCQIGHLSIIMLRCLLIGLKGLALIGVATNAVLVAVTKLVESLCYACF